MMGVSEMKCVCEKGLVSSIGVESKFGTVDVTGSFLLSLWTKNQKRMG